MAIDHIQKEVAALPAPQWQPHINKYDYNGEWNVFSLRSPGGSQNTLAESLRNETFTDTVWMRQCPAISRLVNSMSCEKQSVRLLNLKPGAFIKEHTDKELYFEKGEVRLHIPVFTNPQVEFFLDHSRLIMEEGQCWYINANLPHRLANKSNTDRIHLVIDCRVNDWLQSIFQNDVFLKSELSDDEILFRETGKISSTILELRRQTGNFTALKLAGDLENKLNDLHNKHHFPADIIISFIRSIGIAVHEEEIEENTFLPGILMRRGELVVDRGKLIYPGDLLHEAGHIATVPPSVRHSMNGNLEVNEMHKTGELMAIPWSYAACIHLNIDPYIVFHEHGYQGGGDNIIENFRAGRFFGTPMLQWCGMTIEPKNSKGDDKVFPQMIKWMRGEDSRE